MKEDLEERKILKEDRQIYGTFCPCFKWCNKNFFLQKDYLNVFDNKSRENHLLLKMSIVYSAKHIALMNGSVIASEL